MKNRRNILLIIMIIIFPMMVLAKENVLKLEEKNGKLTYTKDLNYDNVFLKHLDLIPGETYTDEMWIETTSSKVYDLYFKLSSDETDEDLKLLLQSLNIKISLDGNKVYEGEILKTNDSKNEKGAVLLGTISSKKRSKLVVETTLSEDFLTPISDSVGLNWTFFAKYGTEIIEVVEVPNTMHNVSRIGIAIAVIGIIVGALILLKTKYMNQRKSD